MIYKKLLEFQKLGISIKKDKRNPHFKNDYASLNEVLDKVKEELNKLGVLVIQSPEKDGLRTMLIDVDSVGINKLVSDAKIGRETELSYIESFTPFINPTDMQKLGGAITYARRYALVSMLALEDEDLDGNNAVDNAKSVKSAATTNNDLDL